MCCDEGTNITVEKVVNHYKTQMIDALKESCICVVLGLQEGDPKKASSG